MKWPITVVVGFLIGITAFALTLVLSDVITQAGAFRGGQTMRERGATYFTSYYPSNDASNVSTTTLNLLIESIGREEAYSTVVQNVRLEQPGFAQGNKVILIAGNAAKSIITTLKFCTPAPCVMRGADLTNPVGPITFGSFTTISETVLPHESTFFDPNIGAIPVDDALILFLPATAIASFDVYEKEEATTRAVFVTTDESRIADFVATSVLDGLVVIPQIAEAVQPNRIASIMAMSSLYVIALLALLGSAYIACYFIIAALLRAEKPNYRIRSAHGAEPRDIAFHIAGLTFIITIPLALPPLLVLCILPPPFPFAAAGVGAGLVLTSFAVWARFVLKERKGVSL